MICQEFVGESFDWDMCCSWNSIESKLYLVV